MASSGELHLDLLHSVAQQKLAHNDDDNNQTFLPPKPGSKEGEEVREMEETLRRMVGLKGTTNYGKQPSQVKHEFPGMFQNACVGVLFGRLK